MYLEVFMKISNASDLGTIIKIRRKELHYTQAYLSEYTGFSISFISDLDMAKQRQNLEKLSI